MLLQEESFDFRTAQRKGIHFRALSDVSEFWRRLSNYTSECWANRTRLPNGYTSRAASRPMLRLTRDLELLEVAMKFIPYVSFFQIISP